MATVDGGGGGPERPGRFYLRSGLRLQTLQVYKVTNLMQVTCIKKVQCKF